MDLASQYQGIGGFVHPTFMMMDGTVCTLLQYTVVYLCFELEKKTHITFLNFKWFDECMYGTCWAQ